MSSPVRETAPMRIGVETRGFNPLNECTGRSRSDYHLGLDLHVVAGLGETMVKHQVLVQPLCKQSTYGKILFTFHSSASSTISRQMVFTSRDR